MIPLCCMCLKIRVVQRLVCVFMSKVEHVQCLVMFGTTNHLQIFNLQNHAVQRLMLSKGAK